MGIREKTQISIEVKQTGKTFSSPAYLRVLQPPDGQDAQAGCELEEVAQRALLPFVEQSEQLFPVDSLRRLSRREVEEASDIPSFHHLRSAHAILGKHDAWSVVRCTAAHTPFQAATNWMDVAEDWENQAVQVRKDKHQYFCDLQRPFEVLQDEPGNRRHLLKVLKPLRAPFGSSRGTLRLTSKAAGDKVRN